MKKGERIEEMVAAMDLAGGAFDPCYLGYFACFNDGKYYEAHDVLEHLWLADRGPDAAFYKGLIQIAGAFVHLKKQFERPDHPKDGRRLHPAVRLFGLGRRNLELYAPFHLGLDVERVLEMCRGWVDEIEGADFSRNPWTPAQGPRLELRA